MKIINGKKIAEQISKKVKKMAAKIEKPPVLAVILVGYDNASQVYVKRKEEACAKAGIGFRKFIYDKTTTKNVADKIKSLNENKKITGILVQLPLPKNLNTDKIISAINPKKDVDGFCKKTRVLSPVYGAIFESLKYARTGLKNKSVAILSNSKTFSAPLKKIFSKNKSKVRIFIKPKRQKFSADIVISALGKPKFITSKMIKNGAILIDVGITRVNGKVYGDFDAETFKNTKCAITPVPGGIGPITVAKLLENILALTKN